MKRLLFLLLLLPTLIFGQKYKVFPWEYDCFVFNPITGQIISVVTGQPIPGAPLGIVIGSGSLHHGIFADPKGNTYVIGDNTSNISGTGVQGATIGWTQTPVTNAKQVVAYANGGDPLGLGYGDLVVTNDGKLILMGNSQSGFRNDGTEGNQSEPAPFVIQNLPAPVTKIAAGSAIYALLTDSTVWAWGSTRLQYWPTYALGRGVDNPDATKAAKVVLPEKIVDVQGGGNMTYFIGASGAIYGVAFDTRYLGLAPVNGKPVPGQNTPFNLTKTLNLPGTPAQIAVGPQATYARMANGDVWSWGDNTQAAIGNGKEATFANFTAPWTGSWTLSQYAPVKVNPAGISFVKIFTSIGDAFYVYAEDTNGNLWVWGRNKGFVLWNGIGGTSAQQAAQPNMWDVLSPMKITGFGNLSTVPPPVITPACPTCPTCPPVVVCPPPVACPVCPAIPPQRTVTSATIHINGVAYSIPVSWLTISYSDGSTQ